MRVAFTFWPKQFNLQSPLRLSSGRFHSPWDSDPRYLHADALQLWGSWWMIPRRLNVFMGWEGVLYDLHQNTQVPTSSPAPPNITQIQAKGARYHGGFSHILKQVFDEAQTLQYQLQLFERIEYQIPTNLKSPVFGIPSLAEHWQFTISLALSWGPQPLNEYGTPTFSTFK